MQNYSKFTKQYLEEQIADLAEKKNKQMSEFTFNAIANNAFQDIKEISRKRQQNPRNLVVKEVNGLLSYLGIFDLTGNLFYANQEFKEEKNISEIINSLYKIQNKKESNLQIPDFYSKQDSRIGLDIFNPSLKYLEQNYEGRSIEGIMQNIRNKKINGTDFLLKQKEIHKAINTYLTILGKEEIPIKKFNSDLDIVAKNIVFEIVENNYHSTLKEFKIEFLN